MGAFPVRNFTTPVLPVDGEPLDRLALGVDDGECQGIGGETDGNPPAFTVLGGKLPLRRATGAPQVARTRAPSPAGTPPAVRRKVCGLTDEISRVNSGAAAAPAGPRAPLRPRPAPAAIESFRH